MHTRIHILYIHGCIKILYVQNAFVCVCVNHEFGRCSFHAKVEPYTLSPETQKGALAEALSEVSEVQERQRSSPCGVVAGFLKKRVCIECYTRGGLWGSYG